jgi:hypothetical protein
MASSGLASGDSSQPGEGIPEPSSAQGPLGADEEVMDLAVVGSRRLSNLLVASAVSIGGIGFLLTSASSRLGRNLMPIGHAADLTWVPQGLVMGLY